MARFKPDIEALEGALRPSAQRKVRELRVLHARGYRPQTLHLHEADFHAIFHDLSGSGYDVARGVVFKGIPVKPYAA